MNIHQPNQWVRHYYNNITFKVDNKLSKTIYLTFDDGPTPEITNWILDQLAQYDAKATFFCIGRNVEHYPELYSNILSTSHSVGNHTYSHLKGWKTNTNEYLNDIELAKNYIDSKLFRPPYGRIKMQQINKLIKQGYRLFMWDVLSEDYNQNKTPEQCLNYVLKYTTNGSIIVFHDSVKAFKNLKEILPKILKIYTEKGYNFCKLQ